MKTIAASKVTFLPKTSEPFWSFSVRSLIVLSTAVACGCTLAVRLPGLGWVIGALLIMVTIRTLLVIKRRREKGILTNNAEKGRLFFRSLVRGMFAILILCAGVIGSFVIGFIGLMLAAGVVPGATTITVIAWLLPIIMLGYLVSGMKRRFHDDVCHRL
jgi:hypothetical protein